MTRVSRESAAWTSSSRMASRRTRPRTSPGARRLFRISQGVWSVFLSMPCATLVCLDVGFALAWKAPQGVDHCNPTRDRMADMFEGEWWSRGCTSRLANVPDPVPIRDDDGGRYNMMVLDGLLVNSAAQFEGLGEWLR
ncbi:hypothetical protein B0I37DRAFT_374236 [Chaetomium sp. MPI-CAGE-AT-0009]|nr:hypothetical protein B0I37DRAFT_374236 [Chaetomium sp. MPI-CAGE-AT-0009]